jgi:hypothetical protein
VYAFEGYNKKGVILKSSSFLDSRGCLELLIQWDKIRLEI